MKIIIHRGINQIGGCITEIATDKTRILIDFGQNRPNGKGEINDKFASEEAVTKLTKGVNAIIYTHYHGDHIGLFNFVPPEVEQYMGETALEVMRVKQSYLRKEDEVIKLQKFIPYKGGRCFYINKDIRITPYFVSHSACDSNMILVEAEGKRVLHTGDFRNHGYLGKGFEIVISEYIKHIDFLITEGTMLSRNEEKISTERELLKYARGVMHHNKYVFVLCSSTDIERLATFHKANIKGRLFVCDFYQSNILKVFTESNGQHTDLFKFSDLSIFPKDGLLAQMKETGFCALVRVSSYKAKYAKFIERLIHEIPYRERCLIYSMWSGYVDKGKYQKTEYIDFRKRFSSVKEIHTSGHASQECLTWLCDKLNPTSAIIPIHTEQPDNFKKLSISEELKNKIVVSSCLVDEVDIEIR